MKAQIELGFIRGVNIQKTRVPFWFTGDQAIHLSAQNPKMVIETDTLPDEHLFQILLALQTQDIVSEQTADLFKIYDARDQARKASANIDQLESNIESDIIDEVEEELHSEKEGIINEIIEDIAKDEELESPGSSPTKGLQVKQLAEKILALSITKLTKEVNKIDNVQLLNTMFNIESGKEKQRTSIVNLIKKRISSINEFGVSTTTPDGLELTDEEYATIQVSSDDEKGTDIAVIQIKE